MPTHKITSLEQSSPFIGTSSICPKSILIQNHNPKFENIICHLIEKLHENNSTNIMIHHFSNSKFNKVRASNKNKQTEMLNAFQLRNSHF